MRTEISFKEAAAIHKARAAHAAKEASKREREELARWLDAMEVRYKTQ
jgi:hypothetical protein